MKNKIINYYSQHKISILIVLAVLAGSSYYFYSSAKSSTVEVSYTLGAVEKGVLIKSVSGSGQITSTSQIEVKPTVSANIKSIAVKNGQQVNQGDKLAELETKDLATSLRQAKDSLSIAKANLSVKLAGADENEIALSKNSVETAKTAYETSITNLENVKTTAQMSLEKAEMSVDSSETALENAEKSYDNTLASLGITTDEKDQTLSTTYFNAKSTLASSLINLRSAYNSADTVLEESNSTIGKLLGVLNMQTATDARTSYNQAKISLDDFENSYEQASAAWNDDEIEGLLSKAFDTFEDMKEMEHNLYVALSNTITSSELSQTTLDGYKSTASSQESSMISGVSTIQNQILSIKNAKVGITSSGILSDSTLTNAKTSLENAKSSLVTAQNNLTQTKIDNAKSIASAESDIKSKKISYENSKIQYEQLIAAPKDTDLLSLRVQVSQAQNSYQQALNNYNSAVITAPIDGIVAKVNQNVGDGATPATSMITIITPQQLAVISLNEADMPNVKVGQKANLAFSAIEDLSMTGVVVDIDTLGAVSQGVVTYNINIALDTEDERVKSEMSVSADIVTDEQIDALMVPVAAVKTEQSGRNYVDAFTSDAVLVQGTGGSVTSASKPVNKYVVIGISNDTYTQITDGLSEGEKIVVRTSNGSASSNTSSNAQQSGMGILGGSFRGVGR